MSDRDLLTCPICGLDYFGDDCKHYETDFFAEIASLRAALEKAGNERDEFARWAIKYYALWKRAEKAANDILP